MPSLTNTFRGTSFYKSNEDATHLMTLWNSLSMFEDYLDDCVGLSNWFDRKLIFPPEVSPIQLAMYLENDKPTFTTCQTAQLYKGVSATISPYDRMMVSGVIDDCCDCCDDCCGSPSSSSVVVVVVVAACGAR